MQKQAVLIVRLVVDDDTTLEDAEQIVCDALEESELMANVIGKHIESIKE